MSCCCGSGHPLSRCAAADVPHHCRCNVLHVAVNLAGTGAPFSVVYFSDGTPFTGASIKRQLGLSGRLIHVGKFIDDAAPLTRYGVHNGGLLHLLLDS